MYDHVARTLDRKPLWHDDADALALWNRLRRALPDLSALVLMPNHAHLLHPRDVRVAFAQVLAGHTRSQGRARMDRVPPARWIADAQKRRRQLRYVHLNPCRAGLCHDPLAWAFSTHRDACGLTTDPVVPRRRDASAFHRYVSSDPHVCVTGTDLPGSWRGLADPEQVLHAVSALTRTTLDGLQRRSPGRSLFLVAGRELCDVPARVLASWVGVSRATVYQATAPLPHLRLVHRVLGDHRFGPLRDGPRDGLDWR